ncbi:MAG: IS200/IS605 family transposase [Acidobacteria bacterium]|nr:IS200/IS605 family transposase [Acidobacteriota bacterium]
MAHSFTCVYLHIIFSTKDRRPLIPNQQQSKLWHYLGGILKNHKMKALAIGGMPDHVHVLVSVSSELSVARAVNLLKSNSSKWMREHDGAFGWQEGYAAFSVSASALPAVIQYIENQAKHHEKRDFRREYIALLKKHDVAYDPRWVFG